MNVAGGLGFAGCLTGLAILLLSCAGFDAALLFSPVPIVMGIAGGLMTLAASWRGSGTIPESSTLASLFVALLAMFGGMLEIAAWLHG